MNPKELLEILSVAEKLKCNTRHCDTSGGRRESVAEHSWRMTLMAYLVSDEFPGVDLCKLLKMCLIHDLGEAFTGDIPAFQKTDANERREEKLLSDWVAGLPEPYAGEMAALYREMNARETTEAKIYKALDNLEAVIQHNEADISTWLPLEYELQQTYAAESVKGFPILEEIQRLAVEKTLEKIAEEKAGRNPDDGRREE